MRKLSRSAALSHASPSFRRIGASSKPGASNLQVDFAIISLFHLHRSFSFSLAPSPWRCVKQILVRKFGFPSVGESSGNPVAFFIYKMYSVLSFLKNDGSIRTKLREEERGEKRKRRREHSVIGGGRWSNRDRRKENERRNRDERRRERGTSEHTRTQQSSQRGGSTATESLSSRLGSSLNERAYLGLPSGRKRETNAGQRDEDRGV